MARTAPSPEANSSSNTSKTVEQAISQNIESGVDTDSLVEILRDKLEAGQGECIYKLNDLCELSNFLGSNFGITDPIHMSLI